MESRISILLCFLLTVFNNEVCADMMVAIGAPTIQDIQTAPLANTSTLSALELGDEVIGMEYDPVEGRLYWATGINMFSTGTDGGDREEYKTKVNGMAIDSPHALLFYTCSDEGLIGVMSLYEFYHKILINDTDISPENIAVDVENRQIYWINSAGGGTIERSLYNGSFVEVVLRTKAKGLVLHLSEKRIYYGMDDALMSSDLDGKDKKRVWQDDSARNISTVKLYNNNLYIIVGDHENSTLLSYNISSDTAAVLLEENNKPYSDVVVYNTELLPIEDNECTINYGDCYYFCLPLPSGLKTCVTPDGQVDPKNIEIVTLKPEPTITRKPEIVITEEPKVGKSINSADGIRCQTLPVLFLFAVLYLL